MSPRINQFFLLFVVSLMASEAARIRRSALDNTISTSSIPTSYDFRDHGKVTSVKNQGACGSAYTFAAVAAIESQYLLRNNQSLDLSEQLLLNCDVRSSLCYSEDKVAPVFEYASKAGIPLETCLPYTSGAAGNIIIADQCDACATQRYKIAGFRQYGIVSGSTFSEDKIAEDLYNYGPATVAIYLPPRNNGTHDFYDNVNYMISSYTGGVLDISAEKCNAQCQQMIVFLLVGYTPDYWIAKASLGPNWGENGYIRFKRGTNFCSFLHGVFAPYLENSVQPSSTPPTTPVNPQETTTAFIPTTTKVTTSTTTPKPAEPTPAPECAAGWTLREGTSFCYRYVIGKDRTPSEMEQWCVNQGKQGHLVSVHSTAESDFLEGLIPFDADNVVIGYKNSVWTDSTTADDFDNWYPNDPKTGCAVLKAPTLQWKTINCATKFQQFICKRNA